MDVAVAPTALPAERTVRAEEQPRLVSLRDRIVWRDAGLVWLGLHAFLVALTYLGWLLPIAYDHKLPHAIWERPYLPWAVDFDGTSYAAIARGGYVTLAQPAFYPLYPLLERLTAVFTLGHLGVAGLLVSNVCCLGAFVLLRALAERELGRESARRALIALAVFPTALFLAAAYAESLFLLLSLGAFLALRAHRWPLVGLLIALATLTRPVGILLLAAVAAEAWSTSPSLRSAVMHPMSSLRTLSPLRSTPSTSVPSGLEPSTSASVSSVSSVVKFCSALLLPILALAGYFTFLDARFGSFFAATHAESNGWGRYLSWPWDGLARASGAIFTVRGPTEVHAFLDIIFTLLFIWLTAAMLRVLPPAYVAYTIATLALVLLTPLHTLDSLRPADWAALHSNSRFMLAVFPLFLLIGRWRPRRGVGLVVLLASLWLLAVFTLSFVNGSWVA